MSHLFLTRKCISSASRVQNDDVCWTPATLGKQFGDGCCPAASDRSAKAWIGYVKVREVLPSMHSLGCQFTKNIVCHCHECYYENIHRLGRKADDGVTGEQHPRKSFFLLSLTASVTQRSATWFGCAFLYVHGTNAQWKDLVTRVLSCTPAVRVLEVAQDECVWSAQDIAVRLFPTVPALETHRHRVHGAVKRATTVRRTRQGVLCVPAFVPRSTEYSGARNAHEVR